MSYTCPRCQTVYDGPVCPRCQTPAPLQPTIGYTHPTPPLPRKNQPRLWVGVVIALVFIVLLILTNLITQL